MKIITIMLAFIMLTTTGLMAQEASDWVNPTAKGHFIVDGDMGGNFTSGTLFFEGDKELEIDHVEFITDIRLGYTVIDNLEVGIGFVYNITETTTKTFDPEDESEDKYYGTEYDLFARYYLLTNKVKPFLGARIGGVTYSHPSVGDGTGFVYGGTVGIAYFLNEHVGFESAIDIVSRERDQDLEGVGNFTTESTNIIYELGFIYVF